MARRVPRKPSDRHRRSAFQEHPPRILPECQQPAAQAGRHRGGRSFARPRHRHRLAHGRSGGAPDAPHGIQPLQRRIQEDIPQSQALRHREVAGSHRTGARDDDRVTPDRGRHGTQHEDRRRGVSGRQDQGHFLLYRRRARGLPRTDQGLRRTVPHTYRDETDRRAAGGGTHRRTGCLRTRVVLRIVDVEFFERHDRRRPRTGNFAQSPETRRTMLEAQVLHDVRVRHLRRRPQGVPASARTAAGHGRRILSGQERHSGRHDDLLVEQGCDGQRHHALHRARQGDRLAEPRRQEGRPAASCRGHSPGGRRADLPFGGGQYHPFRSGQAPQQAEPRQRGPAERTGFAGSGTAGCRPAGTARSAGPAAGTPPAAQRPSPQWRRPQQ